jgi:polysaccharide biosynthesis/export protein
MRTDGSFVASALGAAIVFLALVAPLAAQTPPTAEQLQIFQGLTPEQQQAVLQQMGSATTASPPAGSDAGRRMPTASEAEVRAFTAREEEPRIPVLKPADSVLLGGELASRELTAEQRTSAEDLLELVLSRNPFQLDRDAQLNLPGFAPIPLGGLNEQQAMQRLGADPALRNLKLELTRLPLLAAGVKGLKPYGYDLFDASPAMFSPVTDAAVPADYVVGPGDRFSVQLFGNQNRTYNLDVNREGVVSFPELGPIRVGGLSFSAARRAIEARVSQQMIGVQASVAMGDARSIRVLVLGEAKRTGSYTVSGLATMLTALFASGGVSPIGSLRDIQLKRQGEIVRRLDIYDLLLGGDTSDDAKLLPGDVIFIPPVGPTVSVDGEVKRPAIYELNGESSIAELVRIAGGYTPEADAVRASLTRIDVNGRRIVVDINLNDPAGRGQILRNGDVLRVLALRPQLDAGVMLDGFVHRPGLFAWREGLRLSDVIGSVDELKAGADQHYILVRREVGPERRVALLSADLTAALGARGTEADPLLAARDRVYVFDLAPGRQRIIEPLLEELRLQSDISRPTEIVMVGGRVKVAGQYPLEPGMRVSDLLRAGGNLEPEAYSGSAELARYEVGANGSRNTTLLTIDLAAVRRGDAAANVELRPYDYLVVQETPDWSQQETIKLRGEVRFPGTYAIRKGESLRDVLERAGGLTGQAFPEGSVFTRSDLKALEQRQLDQLAERMRTDLVSLSMQAARAGQGSAGETLLAGQSLLAQLQSARATGRFVIDLPALVGTEARSDNDVILREGDELYIPRKRQEVTVIGEVQNPASHLYLRKYGRSDYLAKSGGATRKADRWHIYVVRADGSVATNKSINAGDTIVVPIDAERMPKLPFWQAVTQILYNVAVSVAAVNSF